MKNAILMTLLAACATAAPKTSDVVQGLCTAEDQDAGLCDPPPPPPPDPVDLAVDEACSTLGVTTSDLVSAWCSTGGTLTICTLAFDSGPVTSVTCYESDNGDGTYSVSCSVTTGSIGQ